MNGALANWFACLLVFRCHSRDIKITVHLSLSAVRQMASLLDIFNPPGAASNAAGTPTPGGADTRLEVKSVLERVLKVGVATDRIRSIHFLRWFIPLGKIWDAQNGTFRSGARMRVRMSVRMRVGMSVRMRARMCKDECEDDG